MFCSICSRLLSSSCPYKGRGFQHQPSFRDLTASAAQGCTLCSFFRTLFLKGHIHRFGGSQAEAETFHYKIDLYTLEDERSTCDRPVPQNHYSFYVSTRRAWLGEGSSRPESGVNSMAFERRVRQEDFSCLCSYFMCCVSYGRNFIHLLHISECLTLEQMML